jgi:5-formyltetrahydrofolate cyclo-ligase
MEVAVGDGAGAAAAGDGAGAAVEKARWRARLLAARRARPVEERERAAHALAAQARELVARTGARVVACYVSFGSEPPTDRLLEVLAADGLELVVPVVRADLDLDWATWTSPASGSMGKAPRERGWDDVELMFVPALAVARAGARLGRGGGSYDRALQRLPERVPVVAIVYDEEIVDQLPTEPHDRSVQAALTPTRLVPLTPHWSAPRPRLHG